MVLMTSPAISRALWLWVCFIILLVHGDSVSGQRNDSVPQDFAGITYRGEWRMVNDSRSFGGRHRLAASAGASAEYTFTGTAFYFMSAKWPYPIRSNVSLDGRAGIILDLQDHDSPERPRNASATVGVAVIDRGVWTNLTNGRHTVRVTVPIGDESAVVDNFLVTMPENSVVETTASATSTGTTGTTSATMTATGTATDTSTETTTASVLDPVETTTGDVEWETYTSTYTTIENLSQETQTVVIVEVPLGTGTAGASNSDSSSSSSSSGGSNRGLAIGFGVAFGVILLVLVIGIIFWIRKRNQLFQERDGGTHVLPPPTREVGATGEAGSVLAGSVRGPGYAAGTVAGSGTATPLPQNNMAGIGSGPLRDSMGRRHSYDGTFLRPHTQPEPWAESFTPVGRAV